MPYCTNCGNQVTTGDQFCGSCGFRQDQAGSASAPPPPPPPGRAASGKDPFRNISARHAATFCYIPWIGWIPSIIVLAAERFRSQPEVRFHAFQGLYLFVVWLFVDWVFGPLIGYTQATNAVEKLMKLGLFCVSIFMLIKTSSGDNVRLPLIGELADRSVSEQR